MNILNIVFYTVVRNLRDRKSMISMLLLPIVLILILGTALGSIFEPQNIGTITVYYVNKDDGALGKNFDEFMKNKEIKDLLTIKSIDSEEKAKERVKYGDADGLIYIDKVSSSSTVLDHKINVYTNKSAGYKASVIKNIVDSFTNGANTVQAVSRISQKTQYKTYDSIRVLPLSTNGKVPRAIDYYSVTMLVMILMYGANYGLYGMGEDYFEEVGARMRSTLVKPYEQFVGKTIGLVFTILIQAIVLILFTKLAYGANWGRSIPLIIFICFTLSVLSTSFGVLCCMFFKTRNTASYFISISIPIFTLVAGGYVKFNIRGGMLKILQLISPNYHAQTAIFNSIYGGSASAVWSSIGILWAASVLMFAVSIMGGRRYLK